MRLVKTQLQALTKLASRSAIRAPTRIMWPPLTGSFWANFGNADHTERIASIDRCDDWTPPSGTFGHHSAYSLDGATLRRNIRPSTCSWPLISKRRRLSCTPNVHS